MNERRKSLRKKTNLPAKALAVATEKGMAKKHSGYEFVVKNLGFQGLSMDSDMPLALGDVIRLRVQLPGDKRPLQLDGEVKRVYPYKQPRIKGLARIGLKLVHLSGAVQRQLISFVGESALI